MMSKRILCGVFVFFFCCWGAAQAAVTTPLFDSIVKAISLKSSSITLHYTEARKLHFLKNPIVSKGLFYFRKPAYLEQQELSPRLRRFVIDQDRLTLFEKGKASGWVNLEHYPDVWALATTIRILLSGDAAFFHRYYQVSAHGVISAWRLQLTPKAYLKLHIRMITVSGNKGNIKTLVFDYKTGDSVKLQLSLGEKI